MDQTEIEAGGVTYAGDLFYSGCTIAWDMTRDVWGAPPEPGSTLPDASARNWGIGRQCTGPDAAGFPVAPLLFTIGDILAGRVEHPIRFALPNDRLERAPELDPPQGSTPLPVVAIGRDFPSVAPQPYTHLVVSILQRTSPLALSPCLDLETIRSGCRCVGA